MKTYRIKLFNPHLPWGRWGGCLNLSLFCNFITMKYSWILYFLKWFKSNFIYICNKLLALGNWIRHNLKDKLRNHINIILNAEKNPEPSRYMFYCDYIYIYCDHQWVILWLVMTNNFHYNVLYCMPMLALIGIIVYALARMI